MRRTTISVLAVACALALPRAGFAQTRNSLAEGFGGLTFGTGAAASTLGGSIGFGVTDTFQIVGEIGRLNDLEPSMIDDVLDLTPLGLNVGAFYGEGGVRFIAAPRSAVRPYVEASAGVARLSTSIDGLGGLGALVGPALGYLNRTEPLLGVGGGAMIEGGPVLIDIGYRYKKILAGDSVQAIVNRGTDFEVSQVRIGVGVRF